MHKNLLALGAAALCSLAAALPAQAAVSLDSVAGGYSQSFDSLSGTAWANDDTLAGWSLFNGAGAAITTLALGNGASNTGSFYSFGATGSSERALGGVGSGNAYFGAPASGGLAGHIALALTNNTGSVLDSVTVRFDGEQWRNGGNTSAQSMLMEQGLGAGFDTAAWGGLGPVWTSPVTGSSSAAVDGNGAGLVGGVSISFATSWAPGQTLWLRWAEFNDVGSDHGLAIDNLSVSVTAVPEPESYALMLAGLAALGLLARRRG